MIKDCREFVSYNIYDHNTNLRKLSFLSNDSKKRLFLKRHTMYIEKVYLVSLIVINVFSYQTF